MPLTGRRKASRDVGIALARLTLRLSSPPRTAPSPQGSPPRWSHGRALVALHVPQQGTSHMHPRNSLGERHPTFEFSTDPRTGRAVVTVRILHSKDRATLDAAAFASLVSTHGLSSFYRNKSTRKAAHVLFKSKRDKRVYVVARIIMGDKKGSMVEVVDGDLTNLRRSNLYYRAGGTGGTRRAAAKAPAESLDAHSEAEATSVA